MLRNPKFILLQIKKNNRIKIRNARTAKKVSNKEIAIYLKPERNGGILIGPRAHVE